MSNSHPGTCGPIAVTVGSQPPIARVLYDEPLEEGDTGFGVLFSDAPEDDTDLAYGDMGVVCIHSLIDHHPEVGRALDLAREHGRAYRDDPDADWTPAPRELS